MKVRSFFRTLFNCSNFDKEMEARRLAEDRKRERLKTMISKRTESIGSKAKQLEAATRLMDSLREEYRK